MKSATAALAFALATTAVATASAADLRVVVNDVKTDQGVVMVGLFKDPAAFPSTMLAGQKTAATPGSVTVVFSGLAPGSYAVSAYQDLDGNGKLNKNLLGIPTEPYGFSRDARGRTGPPSFDDAKFDLPAAGAEIVVRIR
ncbi:MAG TPA: DUF2141 domain-containing protein [Burkholderiaceae bacterium]|nr:DUF2141 domain-containing protein [Burkholderiaceae bacterium]